MQRAARSAPLLPTLAWAAGAAGVGVAVAAAGTVAPSLQLALVVAVAALGPLAAVYAFRPHTLIVAFVFLLPLLLSTDVTGAFSPSVIATGGLLALFLPAVALRRGRLDGRVKSLLWPLIGLTAVGMISAVVNSVTSLSDLANAVFKYAGFAGVVVVVYVATDTREKAHALVKALIAGGAVVALYSAFMYVTGRSYLPQYGISRASGTFEHWNELGGYLALVSVPTLMYGLSLRRGWLKTALFGIYAVELVALLLSQTLGSVVGLAIAGLVALFVFFRRIAMRLVLIAAATAIIGFVVMQTVPPVAEHFEIAGARVEDRFSTFTTGYSIFLENPLLGVGSQTLLLDNVLATSDAGTTRTSSVPHNAFLAMAAEKGVFGGLLLIALVVNAMRALVRTRLDDIGIYRLWHIGVILGSIAFLAQNMSNLLVLHARLGAIWLIMIALEVRLIQLWGRTPSSASVTGNVAEAPNRAAAAASHAAQRPRLRPSLQGPRLPS